MGSHRVETMEDGSVFQGPVTLLAFEGVGIMAGERSFYVHEVGLQGALQRTPSEAS